MFWHRKVFKTTKKRGESEIEKDKGLNERKKGNKQREIKYFDIARCGIS